MKGCFGRTTATCGSATSGMAKANTLMFSERARGYYPDSDRKWNGWWASGYPTDSMFATYAKINAARHVPVIDSDSQFSPRLRLFLQHASPGSELLLCRWVGKIPVREHRQLGPLQRGNSRPLGQQQRDSTLWSLSKVEYPPGKGSRQRLLIILSSSETPSNGFTHRR